jgi:hypothetical protein
MFFPRDARWHPGGGVRKRPSPLCTLDPRKTFREGGGSENPHHANHLSENIILHKVICIQLSRPNEVGGYMKGVNWSSDRKSQSTSLGSSVAATVPLPSAGLSQRVIPIRLGAKPTGARPAVTRPARGL